MISKNLKGTPEQKLFADWWIWRQKYYDIESLDEWQDLVELMEDFVRPYIGTELEGAARELVATHGAIIERRHIKRK